MPATEEDERREDVVGELVRTENNFTMLVSFNVYVVLAND